MPKYFDFKVCGYYLYFTAHCIVGCMHVHASNSKLTEGGSAKFFVKSDGESVLRHRGSLSEREVRIIQRFIKENYREMYLSWSAKSSQGFYGDEQ